jgi:DNA-binding XRE family transcriptional regulator
MLGASQGVMAAFLGVNVNTIRSWERGKRLPQPIACRFLSEIETDIVYWRRRIQQDSLVREDGIGRRVEDNPKPGK